MEHGAQSYPTRRLDSPLRIDRVIAMQRKGHWALPEDMDKLHDGIIGYAVDVNLEATAKFETTPNIHSGTERCSPFMVCR